MPLTQTDIFGRVSVDYAVRGVARITWQLRKGFLDPPPYTFQLQVSYNGGGADDTWCDVGLAFDDSNVFHCDEQPLLLSAGDDTARIHGKRFGLVYRVKLTTGRGEYVSGSSAILGHLSTRQWLFVRAIMRRHILEARGLVSYEGFLLKRKTHGQRCVACVDPFTGGVTDSSCAACDGTGIVEGYWLAATTRMINMSPETNYTQRDDSMTRGTVNDVIVKGRFLGLPAINARDVWILKDSDQRWMIHRVQNVAEIDNVPVIVEAELRLVEASDVIYAIETQ